MNRVGESGEGRKNGEGLEKEKEEGPEAILREVQRGCTSGR